MSGSSKTLIGVSEGRGLESLFGLSVTSACAVLALAYMARCNTTWVRAETIATALGVPRPYLVKILAGFRRRQLIATKRGYHGGYRLERSPEEVTLLDVVTTVEGRDFLRRCLLGSGECSHERGCPLHPYWSSERARIRRQLGEVTLRDMAASDFRYGKSTNHIQRG
jgi:Rrf2 family protein